MNDYIVVAIESDDSKNYVMNTSPILWTNDINKAKVFDSYSNAKFELEDNFMSLSVTISYTDISSIWIVQYTNGKEVGRERFL